jgi:hypothetical protein
MNPTRKPLAERPTYRETPQDTNPDALQRDLAVLAAKHGLTGCVLVQFDTERVGVRSWGTGPMWCEAMTTLAYRVLTDIDDGRHDPLEHIPAEGTA